MVTVRMVHPQLSAIGWHWETGQRFLEREFLAQGRATALYRTSPVRPILEGETDRIRDRLEGDAPPRFPIGAQLKARGFTDYAALAVRASDGRPNAVSLATKAPGGFDDAQLEALAEAMPALSVVLEQRAERHLARTICEAYIGPRTGQRVLDGAMERGGFDELRAAVWFSDLRQFSEAAERLGTAASVALLNHWFGLVDNAVTARGGEILKLIGDAALVIFPVDNGDDAAACSRALDAAQHLQKLVAAARPMGGGRLRCGIGIALGDVAYGNIGAPRRLDFTVIGAAVNLAARLERLCSDLDAPVLTSAEVAQAVGGARLVAKGRHRLKGFPDPIEIHGLATSGTDPSSAIRMVSAR